MLANLAIILINLARPAISTLLFTRFFLFRMPDVTALFLLFLILDSIEGVLIFYHRKIWSAAKTIFYHINNILFIFAVTAGVLLYLPLNFFLFSLGINIESERELMQAWVISSVIIFLIVIACGYSMRTAWGNIQYLFASCGFLLYCFYYIPWHSILLSIIVALCLLFIETKKYGFNLSELRKKDIRFRKKYSRYQ